MEIKYCETKKIAPEVREKHLSFIRLNFVDIVSISPKMFKEKGRGIHLILEEDLLKGESNLRKVKVMYLVEHTLPFDAMILGMFLSNAEVEWVRKYDPKNEALVAFFQKTTWLIMYKVLLENINDNN